MLAQLNRPQTQGHLPHGHLNLVGQPNLPQPHRPALPRPSSGLDYSTPQQSHSRQQHTVEKSLPLLIKEDLAQPFSYWDQDICKGLNYNNELYTHFHSYPLTERLQAYEIANEKAEQGCKVCITVSQYQYTVWLSLRSLSHVHTESHSPTLK